MPAWLVCPPCQLPLHVLSPPSQDLFTQVSEFLNIFTERKGLFYTNSQRSWLYITHSLFAFVIFLFFWFSHVCPTQPWKADGLGAHICDRSSEDTETGGLLVWGQPGVCDSCFHTSKGQQTEEDNVLSVQNELSVPYLRVPAGLPPQG